MKIKFYDGGVIRKFVFSTDFNIDFHTNTISIFNSDDMVYEDMPCTTIKILGDTVEAFL